MVPFDSLTFTLTLSKNALEINLFGIARLDSTMLPYMVTLVTIYGNRCMGGRERSSEDHVIGVVFDEESHGNIRFYSFGRRYTVLKQTPRMPWHPPVRGWTGRSEPKTKDRTPRAHSRCRRRRPMSYHRTAVLRTAAKIRSRSDHAVNHSELGCAPM